MIETLLGGLLGGAFRLAPEILKWLDRNGERSHELSMQDKALEFEKLRGASRMAEIGASADAAWNTGAIEAFKEAVAWQGRPSGVKWADGLSTSVRPVRRKKTSSSELRRTREVSGFIPSWLIFSRTDSASAQ